MTTRIPKTTAGVNQSASGTTFSGAGSAAAGGHTEA